MKRMTLTDGSGRWFDREKATKHEEGSRWDGSNHVSLATGSQWDHEALYRTAGGLYILESWSQWQGSRESVEEITPDKAARWLSVNGYENGDAADIGVRAEFDALEMK